MRGHVRKRGNKWCIVVDIGRDPITGKRKQKWFSGYEKEKDAERDLAKKITEILEGEFIEPSSMLLKDYLAEWLEMRKMRLKPNSYRNYSRAAENHIYPHIGGIPVSKLTPLQIQRFYQTLSKTLKNTTILLIHNILRTSMKQAEKYGMIKKNPVTHVEPPKKERFHADVWDEEQTKCFLEHSESSRYHIAFVLAIGTGMRLGEVLGLRWQDIDFERQNLSVRQILSAQDELVLDAKTAGSNRMVSLPDQIMYELRKHKLRVNEERLRLGEHYYNLDLVVCTAVGKKIFRSQFRTVFKKLIEGAGVPGIRFHDLRHTHATLLLKQGVHPKVVAERLGHSSVSMTLNRYSHVLPGVQEEAAQHFGDVIFGKKSTN